MSGRGPWLTIPPRPAGEPQRHRGTETSHRRKREGAKTRRVHEPIPIELWPVTCVRHPVPDVDADLARDRSFTTKNTMDVRRKGPTKASHLRACASFVVDAAVPAPVLVPEVSTITLNTCSSYWYRIDAYATRRPHSNAMDSCDARLCDLGALCGSTIVRSGPSSDCGTGTTHPEEAPTFRCDVLGSSRLRVFAPLCLRRGDSAMSLCPLCAPCLCGVTAMSWRPSRLRGSTRRWCDDSTASISIDNDS